MILILRLRRSRRFTIDNRKELLKLHRKHPNHWSSSNISTQKHFVRTHKFRISIAKNQKLNLKRVPRIIENREQYHRYSSYHTEYFYSLSSAWLAIQWIKTTSEINDDRSYSAGEITARGINGDYAGLSTKLRQSNSASWRDSARAASRERKKSRGRRTKETRARPGRWIMNWNIPSVRFVRCTSSLKEKGETRKKGRKEGRNERINGRTNGGSAVY